MDSESPYGKNRFNFMFLPRDHSTSSEIQQRCQEPLSGSIFSADQTEELVKCRLRDCSMIEDFSVINRINGSLNVLRSSKLHRGRGNNIGCREVLITPSHRPGEV